MTLETLQSALATRYHVEREIGRGGMATVYLARDVKHQRSVALKVLDPELGAVLGAERFLAEIRVTANLQHPNLLPLFDSGEAAGLLFYVMPFVEGESLRARLEREKQLPIDEAVRIATGVANALAYAHSHGVIHRDLKPENILLQHGQPVVADFGIALAVSNAGGARITQTGLSLGTPQYMSPEQATGDRGIDGRTDIYSLGAICYEMLAGEPPHAGTTAQAVIAKLMTTEPRPLTVLRRNVPPQVAATVHRALEKLPADRFATADAFATALVTPTTSAAAVEDRFGHARLDPRFRGGDGVRGTTLGLLPWGIAAIALAAAGWALTRPSPPRPVLRYMMAFDSAEAPAGTFARFALSPDGTRLVYIGGPKQTLMLRRRDALHAEPLPGTEGARVPFFSPQGDKVAFITSNRVLKIASLGGGPPIVVTDSVVGPAGGAWGPDGAIYEDGSGQTALVRVEARAGAVPRYFTTLDTASGEVNHGWPAVLPNGKGILFQIRYGGAKAGQRAIAVADVKTGKHRVLVRGLGARYATSGHLLYVAEDSTLMAVPFDQDAMAITGEPVALAQHIRVADSEGPDIALSASGTLLYSTTGESTADELVWVGRDGAQQAVDSGWRGRIIYGIALSPDGRRAAAVVGADAQSGGGTYIWVKQLDRGPTTRLTRNTSVQYAPTWTADGASITFRAGASGPMRLFTQRADGSAQAVPQPPAQARDLTWSRDGKWAAYCVTTRTGDGIYAMQAGSDTTPTPITVLPYRLWEPAISPDSRWIAYTSSESGRAEVYVVPFPHPGTAKWPISTRGGAEPRWAHSGRELFYRDPDGNLVAAEVRAGATFEVGASTPLFRIARWVSALPGEHTYDVAPDDRRFLLTRPAGATTPEHVVVIENVFDVLKATRGSGR